MLIYTIYAYIQYKRTVCICTYCIREECRLYSTETAPLAVHNDICSAEMSRMIGLVLDLSVAFHTVDSILFFCMSPAVEIWGF